jgi:hypothetical protein
MPRCHKRDTVPAQQKIGQFLAVFGVIKHDTSSNWCRSTADRRQVLTWWRRDMHVKEAWQTRHAAVAVSGIHCSFGIICGGLIFRGLPLLEREDVQASG